MTRRNLLSSLAACLSLPLWPWRKAEPEPGVVFRNCKCGRYRLGGPMSITKGEYIQQSHDFGSCKMFDWQTLTVTTT